MRKIAIAKIAATKQKPRAICVISTSNII